MTNCILWGNRAGHASAYYEAQVFGPVVLAYSDVEGGFPSSTVINLDPRFVGGGDYHLLPDSPCIDAGVAVEVLGDMDGDDRPEGCGFDMGADENTVCYDCDGDNVPDAVCGGSDCDDTARRTYPGAEEACDLQDNNCDGQVDEGPCRTLEAFALLGLAGCLMQDDPGLIPEDDGDGGGGGGCGCALTRAPTRSALASSILVALSPVALIWLLRRRVRRQRRFGEGLPRTPRMP